MPFPVTGPGFARRIKRYFKYIQGSYHMEELPNKAGKGKGAITDQKVWDREPEPPTLSGLALFIGFNSLHEFEEYERNGTFAEKIKRARLMVEAEYEKKLHYQSATGAIFVLKSMGWADRTEDTTTSDIPKTIQIEVTEAGTQPAATEKEVKL